MTVVKTQLRLIFLNVTPNILPVPGNNTLVVRMEKLVCLFYTFHICSMCEVSERSLTQTRTHLMSFQIKSDYLPAEVHSSRLAIKLFFLERKKNPMHEPHSIKIFLAGE